ncbi:MAG: PIN domain-containing protein [Calditrichaeota bacterium]|nr:MAG: PIN domain-containing protein [Calditrichota bacterium]
MNLLIDTDVLIDVALNRAPYARHSSRILDAAQQRRFEAFIAWHSIANFYYLVSSPKSNKAAKEFIRELLTFVNIAPTRTEDAVYALNLPISDFEDALQIAAAKVSGARLIITRNVKHFKKSPIPALTPRDFCEQHSDLFSD